MLNQNCINSADTAKEVRPPLKEETGPERLMRHQSEMAGKVWIPEKWGQEGLLKEWSDCAAFDRSMVPDGLLSARKALMAEYRRTNSGGISIEKCDNESEEGVQLPLCDSEIFSRDSDRGKVHQDEDSRLQINRQPFT